VTVALVLAVTALHLAAGAGGVVAYYWRIGGFWESEPHPLGRIALPAIISWVAAGSAIAILAGAKGIRARHRLQLALPVAWLAAWLMLVAMVGPYATTLEVEARPGRLAVLSGATTQPASRQVLVLTNDTRSVKSLGLQGPTRKWIAVDPIGCFMVACGSAAFTVQPGETRREVLGLEPGAYRLACVLDGPRGLEESGLCAPLTFIVSSE
jgi:hypothetical protein